MKIKSSYIWFLCLIIVLLGICLFRHSRFQTLEKDIKLSGLLPEDVKIKEKALSLTAQSLIFYHVTSEEYPALYVRRIQIQNDYSIFKLSLQGIRGSLIQYYQETEPYAFKHTLDKYTPAKDLLSQAPITLSILGETDLDLDVSLNAALTAPNQITVVLNINKGYQKKARFISKFTPSKQSKSILQELKDKKLTFHADYLCADWKTKLDDYCLSKNIPFFTENAEYNFSF